MGSGKYEPHHIGELTQEALAAFQAHLASHSAPEPSRQSPPPSASQGPQEASGGDAIPTESRPVHEWSNDKAFYGKKDGFRNGKPTRDVTWGEWLADATAGDEDAKYALKAMAGSRLSPDPKYHKNDRVKIGRAKRCLELLRQQPQG